MKHLRSPVQVYAEAFVFSLTPASIARTCSRAPRRGGAAPPEHTT